MEGAMTTRKRMVVARPIGKFINGDQRGVMDKKRLTGLADNFKKYPRQVPVYALGDHVTSLDERLPDGWVEGVEVTPDGELVADVKLHGQAVALVLNDLIRGASIGTIQGASPDGTAQGEVLQHILLTNEPFIKGLNIAASQPKGGELAALFFTALPKKEASMADEKVIEENARLKDEIAALKAMSPDEKVAAQLTETQALLSEKIREVAELTASNENLKRDVEKFKSPKAIEELNKTIQMQDRQLRAEKVRRLVRSGVERGQFNRAFVGCEPKTGYDHPSDEMVLSWFKGHEKFKGSVERLEIILDSMPEVRLRREYGSGEPLEAEAVTVTAQDEEFIRSQGMNPEKVKAAMKAKGDKAASQYAALTAAKE